MKNDITECKEAQVLFNETFGSLNDSVNFTSEKFCIFCKQLQRTPMKNNIVYALQVNIYAEKFVKSI